jgi:hypothetical protein
MLRLTLGILVLWGVWALVFDVIADGVFLTFRAFGLISPLVGLICLVLSIFGLIQAYRLGAPKGYALAAIALSVVIGVVPFAILPYDPS